MLAWSPKPPECAEQTPLLVKLHQGWQLKPPMQESTGSCFSMRSSLMTRSCLIWCTGLDTRAVLWPNKRAVVSKCLCSFLGLHFCTEVGIHSLLLCSFIFHTDSVVSVTGGGSSKFCNGCFKCYWRGDVFSSEKDRAVSLAVQASPQAELRCSFKST